MELIQRIQDTFFKNFDYFAKAWESDGSIGYSPVQGRPEDEEVKQHLDGDICLGGYTLRPDSTVNWLCWDIDSRESIDKARNITLALSEKLGPIPHSVEWSGNKGYHVWIFLTEAIPAKSARAFGVSIRDAIGAPSTGKTHVEFFPKQDSLDDASPIGNLVKLPGGLHPKSKKRSLFLDLANGWEDGPGVDFLAALNNTVSFDEISKVTQEGDPIEQLVNLIAPYFVDGERHDITLNLAGFLAMQGWAKESVEEVIAALIDRMGASDPKNLYECIEDTYRRLADNKTIQGYRGLNDKLPANAMRTLLKIAGAKIADPGIQIIDRIRLSKMAPFQKLRAAEQVIFADLLEMGKLISAGKKLYWLDNVTHQLMQLTSIAWQSMLKTKFGINPKETFGAQLIAALQLEAFKRATPSEVHKRFYWNGRKLYLNFGGPEVYVIDGDQANRQIIYNGDNDLIFQTEEHSQMHELTGQNLFEVAPIDPWQYLTNNLSFAANDNTRATNEQQRQMLRAWILQIFFGTMANTRPIALFIGPAGSGKTTAARTILRFFEGFDKDVLGIAEDKSDSLRVSVDRHLVLALDNVEQTKAKWLVDMLNRLATGAHIELRKLYTENEGITIKPDVWCMLTGIGLPTNEESLFSRLLPLNLDNLGNPKPEYYMQSLLRDNYLGAWAGMIQYLEEIIPLILCNHDIESPTKSRLADFQVFCAKIQNSKALDGKALMDGLIALTDSQKQALSANSAAVTALELWLDKAKSDKILGNTDNDPQVWRSAPQLFAILSKIAREARLPSFNWTTPNGFTLHFKLLASGLEYTHGLKQRTVRDKRQGRDILEYQFL